MATATVEQTREKVYRAARPTLTDEDAAIIGPILEEMAEAGKGRPQDIVEAAAPEQSPLHRYFTWDDSQAAREHRLYQARQLARSFHVEIVTVERGERTVWQVPGLISIRVGGERRYETVEQVQSDEEKTEQACAAAMRLMIHFRSLYSAYRHAGGFTRLEPVFQALDAIQDSAPVGQ